MSRILETYAPSTILLSLMAGALTIVFGLEAACIFLSGALVWRAGRFLDTYGQEHHP